MGIDSVSEKAIVGFRVTATLALYFHFQKVAAYF